jgi:hypothetical protein
VDIPEGLARTVKLVELNETGVPGPFNFNGTFGIITTTRAGIGIVDIEDNDLQIEYIHPHRTRSIVDLTDEDEIPKIDDDPVLIINDDRVSENKVGKYIELVELDGGVGCDAGDAEENFKLEYDEGIRFKCDPYMSKRGSWIITWEGPIGLSGTGIITNINENEPDSWFILNEDSAKDFCESELYTEGTFEDYPGDILVITSEPTPDEGSEDLCEETYENIDEDNPLAYRIVGLTRGDSVDDDTDTGETVANVIEFEKFGPNSLDLLPECFGRAIEFEVRASEHWVIKGESGYDQTAGEYDPESGACLYDDNILPSRLRVYEGETFQNEYIQFKMVYGDDWKETGPKDEEDTDPSVEAIFSFEVIDGYEEMYRTLGATNITDIEIAPDGDLLLVDKGGEGLIVFDMLENFSVVGSNIN